MSLEYSLKKEDDYLFVEFRGEYHGNLSVLKLEDIKQTCQHYGYSRLLVDIRSCKLNVTIADRYQFGEEIAKIFVSPVLIKIAMLVSPEQYNDFVTIVAENRGAVYEAFTDKKEALTWLLE